MSIWSHFRTTPCTSVGYTDAGGVPDDGRLVGGPGTAGTFDVSTARSYGTSGLIRVWVEVEGEPDAEVQLTPDRARLAAQSLLDAADYCEGR